MRDTQTQARRLALSVTLLVAVALLVVACSAPTAPASAPKAVQTAAAETPVNKLVGTEWQLESMLDGAARVPAIPPVPPTLGFAVDRYVGFGGCDWFVGLHILKEQNGIQIEAPAKTMGGCTTQAKLIEQQGTYMQLLLDSTRFAMEDGKLITYIGEGQKALTMTPLEPVPFEGTTWQFSLYYSTGTTILTPGVPGTTLTARFQDGKVTGNAGCNEYSGTYERTGDKLTIGPLTTTRKACSEPQGIMEQETAYLSKLQSTGMMTKLPRTMLLSASDGQPLLLYKAVVPDAAG